MLKYLVECFIEFVFMSCSVILFVEVGNILLRDKQNKGLITGSEFEMLVFCYYGDFFSFFYNGWFWRVEFMYYVYIM